MKKNKSLFKMVKNSQIWIILTVFIQIMKLGLNIIQVYVISSFIGKLFHKEFDKFDLVNTLIVIIVITVFKFMINVIKGRISSKISSDIRTNLRNNIYEKLIEIEYDFRKATNIPSIASMMVDGIESLKVYYEKYIPQLFYSVIAPVILFVYFSRIHSSTAFVLLFSAVLIPVSIVLVMKRSKRAMSDFWSNYQLLGSYFFESLKGLTTLIQFNRDKERGKVLKEKSWNFRNSTMKVLRIQLSSILIMDIVAYLGSAVGIILGLLAFSRGSITLPEAVIIILLSAEFFLPLRTLGSYFHAGMNGVSAGEKILELLETKTDKSVDGIKKCPKAFSKLSFNDVSFSYNDNKQVIRNVSFDVEKGKTISFVGNSGSGKSTIASLIMRFYDANDGIISFNGEDIRNFSKVSLRKKITLITHNSHIFIGTIKDNLMIGKYDATEEDMIKAVEKVGLYDFIKELPEKFDTPIGEDGNKLSGGQKQRLSIARAILYDPEVYIFDEATSNIDIENEEKIWKVVSDIAKEKTVIIISHRLSSIINTDKIFVLDNSSIVEEGNHRELIQKDGLYKTLFEKQTNIENYGEVVYEEEK